ncbi:disulfide bond formation protein B [Gilvimarinus agarilyticus]|uniref:disulfide bond formation protein B n=1 Tax=Gilvimarinus agarilyticus TaxID=679259 RepID=UPI0005A1904F|nr:disulfide bond formation protein B [Gilvimarinus agarilyticus]
MKVSFLNRLLYSAHCRYFWLAVAGLMLALEIGALLFQHVWHYYPCELCIYVRVWVAAIFIVSLLALWLKRWRVGRVVSVLAGLGLSIGLSLETWSLIKVEYAIGHGSSCGFRASFPSWAPLDEWMPWMFQVQDMCQATPPVILGLSMAHCLVMVSFVLLVVFGLALYGSVKKP